jgi:hypothetical protein
MIVGPHIENFALKFFKQSKLGDDIQDLCERNVFILTQLALLEEFQGEILYVGADYHVNDSRPPHREFRPEILQAKQAGLK